MRAKILGILLVAVLCLSTAATADMEAIRAGYGSLIISGVFQVGFSYHFGDEELGQADIDNDGTSEPAAIDRAADAEFWVNYARLALKGMIIDDKVRYFIQLDLNPEDENVTGPQLLDAKIGLKYIPYTTLWAGRFAPNFTFFNPLNVARLGMIDYPLMNKHIGVQRQTGLTAEIDHKWFEFVLGATNGLQYANFAESLNPEDRQGEGLGNEGWDDENTMKDVFASAAIKPVYGMRIWGGYWYGNPLDYFEEKRDGEIKPHYVKVGITNAGFAYMARFGLTLLGEFLFSELKYDNNDAEKEQRDDRYLRLRTMSYYGRLGFNMKELVGIPLEFLVQYDWLDPDLKNDKDTHGKDDELTYYTGGLNYYIKDWHAMMSVNYIYKDEKWKVYEMDLSGDIQTCIVDDELKAQLQVAF